MSLSFNTNTALADQTLVDGVSHLNEYITISTDHGVTYSALDPLDTVSLYGSQIGIIFYNAKQQGSVKVKVAPGVLSDLYDSKRNSTVEATVAYNTPELTGYFYSNTESEFAFTDNAAWREHVGKVTVYDRNVGQYRTLNASEYVLSEGKLTLAGGIFTAGTRYTVTVDAEGYSSKYLEGGAYKSSEVFSMTAPVVTADNGITATIRLFNNAYAEEVNGNQTILFELFDGNAPVSIVAANLKLSTGTYSANFNVSDVAVNPNYSVKSLCG
ncbi:hemoblobin-interacting domain-containing protein [Paenibacillus rhizoplanae]